jgi:hypothetical protein
MINIKGTPDEEQVGDVPIHRGIEWYGMTTSQLSLKLVNLFSSSDKAGL